MTDSPLLLDSRPLTFEDVVRVARASHRVQMDDSIRPALEASSNIVRDIADDDEAVYGVNTGFGSLARTRISPDQVREVQRNLIRSHAAGVGSPLPDEVVRAMMLILAASLSRGMSGVRPIVIERLIDLLNHDVTPVIPSRGSVGASGDLAPLAHLALVLIGEGVANFKGARLRGADALRSASLDAIQLEAKEGLALINGTHLMCALGVLALHDALQLFDAALVSAAMAIDACRGTDAFLDARLHEARKQAGQAHVASRLRVLLADSQIIPSHEEDDPRVQDPYSLRATPQVLGAAHDTLVHVRTIFENELSAVTDNPLVFRDGSDIISGGNFHGMPLAIALDSVKIALCAMAGIAERRVNWLLTASDSENPVNVYLSPQPGLHSGLMIAQYTAAACCNEMQTLASPASVGNIPTSAGMEDFNSMGATAALQCRQSVELATNVIAIELLTMCEAMEYQRPLRSGAGVERAYDAVRRVVPRLTEDRPPAPDIAAIHRLICSNALAVD